MKLQNKRVLITGASSGLGKAVALRVSKDGASLILAARNIDALNLVKEECEKAGATDVLIIPTDVTDPKQVKNLFLQATVNREILDFVFDNAGLGYIAEIQDLTAEQIQAIINVNVTGMIMVAKYATEIFVRQKYGHLMMTSSLAGLISLPQWSVYVASKWAITGFSNSIRYEMKKYNVKVSTLHPGAVKTEFFNKDKADVDISKLGDAIDASVVAEKVYEAIFTNKKKIIVPSSAKSYAFLSKILPGFTDSLIERMASQVEYHENLVEDEPDFDFVVPKNLNE